MPEFKFRMEFQLLINEFCENKLEAEENRLQKRINL